jgi:hypothetical protein
VIGWDSKWVFFEHRFVRKDRVLGVVAGRVVLKAQSGPVESVAVGHAEFLKDFGPRVTELLDRLQKAAGVSERPMALGDLDILAAASWELLTTTLANMPESQRRRRVRQLSETLARERLEQKIVGRLDMLRRAPPEDSA